MRRWIFMLLTLVLLCASPGWAADEFPLSILKKTDPVYARGFITGFFQGMPMQCPAYMSGSVLKSMLDRAIYSGRAIDSLDVRVVLYQLMREAGCRSDPTILEGLDRLVVGDGKSNL